MAGVRGRERLQPSLLDRLSLADAPTSRPGERGAAEPGITAAQLREAVLRDLTSLMNASNLATLVDLEAFPRVAQSTLNYGIPGFAGMFEASARAGAMERDIAEAIRIFEPRVRPETLRVRARGLRESAGNPALVFEIEGELWAQPVALQLFLETAIDVETRLAVVTEIKGAG